ncbi:MAG: hypothetical protein PHZ02_07135 [Desulfocapsaceae bacterium]|nr:hypothetical protein [Desulfocapsaceae bacterium]
MIGITIDDKQVRQLLKALPKQAGRAAEQALDFTAVRIADEVRTQMLRRFDNPTQFTLNSLKVTKTKGHNMMAMVGFKEPARMADHYLLPQVEGGERKLKGFERALGTKEYIPSTLIKLNANGNITHAMARNAITSKEKNNKGGYVLIKPGNRGKLIPGVYQRFKTDRATGRKSWRQMGNRKVAVRNAMGRIVGWSSPSSKIRSAITPQGLKPIMLQGRTGKSVKPLLPFYEIAHTEYNKRFLPEFTARFNALKSK